jgi:hypothetical protein
MPASVAALTSRIPPSLLLLLLLLMTMLTQTDEYSIPSQINPDPPNCLRSCNFNCLCFSQKHSTFSQNLPPEANPPHPQEIHTAERNDPKNNNLPSKPSQLFFSVTFSYTTSTTDTVPQV